MSLKEKTATTDPDQEYLEYLQAFGNDRYNDPYISKPLTKEEWLTHKMVMGVIRVVTKSEKSKTT